MKVVNPFPRLAHTSNLVGPMLFVFGGHDGCDYTNELSALNLGSVLAFSFTVIVYPLMLLSADTMEWLKMSTTGSPPSARGYHSAVLTDSRLFVFGGYDNERCFDEIHILDLATLSYL